MAKLSLPNLCACAALALAAVTARADETITGGILPYTTGAPGYPNAFSGLGYVGSIDHTWIGPRLGLGLDYEGQGSGMMITLHFRYYFGGLPQIATMSGGDAAGIEIKPRTWGLFIEGGPTLYKLSQLGAITPTASSPPSEAGIGASVALGLEYPLFWGFFATLKAHYCDSLGGPLSILTTSVSLGFPLRF